MAVRHTIHVRGAAIRQVAAGRLLESSSLMTAAGDPERTLGVFGLRCTFVTFQKRTILGQSEIRLGPAS